MKELFELWQQKPLLISTATNGLNTEKDLLLAVATRDPEAETTARFLRETHGEDLIPAQRYHQITESKNGECIVPIGTERGWLHIAHGVRSTAAGLRYVLYAYATDREDPSRVIAEPGGLLLGPLGWERVGDVSNVVFSNGAIVKENGEILLYYAGSDTRVYVAKTSIAQLSDYIFNTPPDPGRSVLCVRKRCELIDRNLEILERENNAPHTVEESL